MLNLYQYANNRTIKNFAKDTQIGQIEDEMYVILKKITFNENKSE